MSADFVAEDPVLWDVKLRRLANNFGRFEGLYSAFEKSGNFVQQHNVTFQNTRVFSNSIIWNKQPTIQITNHPTNQPTNESTNEPTNEPTNQLPTCLRNLLQKLVVAKKTKKFPPFY